MTPETPAGLAQPGLVLWRAVVDVYDLEAHELVLLEEAARTRDRLADLRAEVEAAGLWIDSSQGGRLHPAVAEVRSHSLALARLLATLRVPGVDADDLPAARPLRGVHTGQVGRHDVGGAA